MGRVGKWILASLQAAFLEVSDVLRSNNDTSFIVKVSFLAGSRLWEAGGGGGGGLSAASACLPQLT